MSEPIVLNLKLKFYPNQERAKPKKETESEFNPLNLELPTSTYELKAK